jgi:exodeoxyribonuclease VII large subunit
VPKARRDGHFFCELVDVDDDGSRIAHMHAVIWSSAYITILRKFEAAGESDGLKGNREIHACCSIQFHDVYGLRLQIHDVDPPLRRRGAD